MALNHVPLDRIDVELLKGLIDASAPEAQHIDYKRETYGGNDAARAEYLADVSSFANTVGGDLLIGIDAPAGVPTRLTPFTGDADAERLRLEQMARAGLEPRIPNLQTKAVVIGASAILVLRVSRSYMRPHRVIFQGKNKFWARSSAGKYEPNVDELRAMFNEAPQLAERMRHFREERLARIGGDESPAQLLDNTYLVLHVIPFSHFDLGPLLSIEEVARHPDYFPPFRNGLPAQWRVNFDGFLTLSNADENAAAQRAYVQLFRSGAIEAVACSITRGGNNVNIQQIDQMIVRFSRVYALALKECGIEPPLVVMASLCGMKGRGLTTGVRNVDGNLEGQIADRDQLLLTEVIFEQLPSGDQECATILRPVLDQLSNAAGRASAISFDGAGNYLLTAWIF